MIRFYKKFFTGCLLAMSANLFFSCNVYAVSCTGKFSDGRAPTLEEVKSILQVHTAWVKEFYAIHPQELQSDLSISLKHNRQVEVALNDERRANFCGANMRDMQLPEFNFSFANMAGVNLREANLQNTVFLGADLSEANLMGANLEGSFMTSANLHKAKLHGANMSNCDLNSANMSDAGMYSTNLTNAEMITANIDGAKMFYTNLDGTFFEPTYNSRPFVIPPPVNLDKIVYDDNPFALKYMQNEFKTHGYRQQEREITYAINSRVPFTRELEDYKMVRKYEYDFEYVLKYIAFDLTTKWGMVPSRALYILLYLILFFTPVYYLAMKSGSNDGIWRVWNEHRVRQDLGHTKAVLVDHNLLVAFYFSLISAFRIGWRDINVGFWITNIQKREYTYVATGWARTISGLQSLISVYLIALWVLTYFGRPFE